VAQDTPLYRRWTAADMLRLGRELNRRWGTRPPPSPVALAALLVGLAWYWVTRRTT
jgi:hypothetical protein